MGQATAKKIRRILKPPDASADSLVAYSQERDRKSSFACSEFGVYLKEQAYPEYVLCYHRVHGLETTEGLPPLKFPGTEAPSLTTTTPAEPGNGSPQQAALDADEKAKKEQEEKAQQEAEPVVVAATAAADKAAAAEADKATAEQAAKAAPEDAALDENQAAAEADQGQGSDGQGEN